MDSVMVVLEFMYNQNPLVCQLLFGFVYFCGWGVSIICTRGGSSKWYAGGWEYQQHPITTKGVWRGLIWPLELVLNISRAILLSLNDLVALLALFVGYEYRESNTYRAINRWMSI